MPQESFDWRYIPDIEVPFPRNRHQAEGLVRAQTRRWALEQALLPAEMVSAFLDGLRYTDLVSGYYVGAPLPVLRAINDFSLWFFVWDDRHDRDIVRHRHEAWSRLRDGLHAALDEPHRHLCHADPLIGSFADCVGRLYQPLSDSWSARFAAHFHATIDAYDQEYRNRVSGAIPTPQQYLALRSHTFGMFVWVDCLELAAGYELPEAVYAGAPYQDAALASQEFSAWYNDLHSMPKEIAAGDFHNLGIVLAHHRHLRMSQAAREVARRVAGRITAYQAAELRVRRLLDDLGADEPLRAGVERCLFNMRNWISSVYWFHRESSRYQARRWADPASPPYVYDHNAQGRRHLD